MSASMGTELMSNELMVVLAVASIAALVGGGLVAWVTTRGAAPIDPEQDLQHSLQESGSLLSPRRFS